MVSSIPRSLPNRFRYWGLARLAIAFVILPGLYGCGTSGASSSPEQSLVITGSSTVAPLVNEMGKQFERDFSGSRIDVQTGGSSRGIADVRAGTADIGMVSRALTDQEVDLQSYPVAIDGIAIIVHQDNPINQLSRDQVKKIYSKQVTQWSEVGGKNAPITVVNKAEGRSTLEVFQSFFQFQPKEIKADVIIGDNQQGLKTVVANPDAIGYVSIGAAQVEIQRGEPLKLLPMDGVLPSLENVKNTTYPLSRELNIVTNGEPSPLVTRFIDYATSHQVTALVSDQQLIPVIPDR